MAYAIAEGGRETATGELVGVRAAQAGSNFSDGLGGAFVIGVVFEKSLEVFQGFLQLVFLSKDHALFVDGDHEFRLGLDGSGEGGEGAVAFASEAEDMAEGVVRTGVFGGEGNGGFGRGQGLGFIAILEQGEGESGVCVRAGGVGIDGGLVKGDGAGEVAAACGLRGLDEEVVRFAESEFLEPDCGFPCIFRATDGVENHHVELPCFGIVRVLGEGVFDGFESLREATGLYGIDGGVVGFDGRFRHRFRWLALEKGIVR